MNKQQVVGFPVACRSFIAIDQAIDSRRLKVLVGFRIATGFFCFYEWGEHFEVVINRIVSEFL